RHVTSAKCIHGDEDVASVKGLERLHPVEREGEAVSLALSGGRFDRLSRRIRHGLHALSRQVGCDRASLIPLPLPLQFYLKAHEMDALARHLYGEGETTRA